MKYPSLFLVACYLALSVGLLVGCGGDSAKEERKYSLRGTVVEVADGQIKVDHEAMPGYMSAMQMTFPVSRPDLLQGLKPGDHVEGQVMVVDSRPVITKLDKH